MGRIETRGLTRTFGEVSAVDSAGWPGRGGPVDVDARSRCCSSASSSARPVVALVPMMAAAGSVVLVAERISLRQAWSAPE